MKPSWLIIPIFLFSGVLSAQLVDSSTQDLVSRHEEDAHDEHATGPMLHINETSVLETHNPTPISYYAYDFENASIEGVADKTRRGGLMMLHAFSLSFAYLILLPIAIALRTASHRLTWLIQALFCAFNIGGLGAAAAYRKTPNLYEGSTHGTTGSILLLLATLVMGVDAFQYLARYVRVLLPVGSIASFRQLFARFGGRKYKPVLDDVASHPLVESPLSSEAQMVPWLQDSSDEIDMLPSRIPPQRPRHSVAESSSSQHTVFDIHDERHSKGRSASFDDDPKRLKKASSKIRKLQQLLFVFIERSLVIFAWGQTLSGITVYLGAGRDQYINGILAHLIKGSIFWFYGMLTFARYSGAWSDYGWAWNAVPANRVNKIWSASFVESTVIFVYGFTQQFMERFGKHPGDPYSAKDIEHISIAIMFWGSGLVGIAMESALVREWLWGKQSSEELSAKAGKSYSDGVRRSSDSPNNLVVMQSNPLPALVIGITGIAMSAHHQQYAFQISIHALWGYLLLGFALCRCLTCFLEWIKPAGAVSRIPGRPPTELVGSIFLGAGGFVFMCSDEEVTFWAMRTHRDDIMMFLNLSIAFTCVAYVFTLAVLVISRLARRSRRELQLQEA